VAVPGGLPAAPGRWLSAAGTPRGPGSAAPGGWAQDGVCRARPEASRTSTSAGPVALRAARAQLAEPANQRNSQTTPYLNPVSGLHTQLERGISLEFHFGFNHCILQLWTNSIPPNKKLHQLRSVCSNGPPTAIHSHYKLVGFRIKYFAVGGLLVL